MWLDPAGKHMLDRGYGSPGSERDGIVCLFFKKQPWYSANFVWSPNFSF